MKKLSILILSLLIITNLGFSQSVKVIYKGIPLNNNVVIDTNGQPSDLFSIPLGLKNLTTSTIQIKVKKIVNNSVTGSDISFCFAGNCFDPTIFTSPTTAVIDKDSTDMSFIADYSPNGKSGISSVTYAFFNINEANDTAKVTINFHTGVGINEISKSDIYFSDAYPNPANNLTTIAYSLPKVTKSASIRISNILGSKISDITIEDFNGKKNIDLGGLNKGIYFYSLIINGETYYTKKLIIK